MRQGVAHGVHLAALPGGFEDFEDGSLDAFVAVADEQLDPTQPMTVEAAQKLRPEGFQPHWR